jgi:hypothetical protein
MHAFCCTEHGYACTSPLVWPSVQPAFTHLFDDSHHVRRCCPRGRSRFPRGRHDKRDSKHSRKGVHRRLTLSTHKRCTCFCERNSTLCIVQQHHSTLFSVATTAKSCFFFHCCSGSIELAYADFLCVCLCTNIDNTAWNDEAWRVTHIFRSCITCVGQLASCSPTVDVQFPGHALWFRTWPSLGHHQMLRWHQPAHISWPQQVHHP